MAEDTAVVRQKPGPKPLAAKYTEQIRQAEDEIAARLPELAEGVLELALGRKPEVCPAHHERLRCPHETVTERGPILDDEEDGEMDIQIVPCNYMSRGALANERMLVYAFNRVAGTPSSSGDRQVNMEFVRKLAIHISDVFKSVNAEPDPEERARQFAYGIAQMWMLIGES